MKLLAFAGVLAIGVQSFMPQQCAPPADDGVDNTTYAYAGTTGIAATPDIEYFRFRGPLIHLYILCRFGPALGYRDSIEWSVYEMHQGQTIVQYCSNFTAVVNGVRYTGVLSTDWHVVGRPS